ncbi:glycine--tRNA ligase subunit beta [Wenzhouxiangella sp. AB-CW3]|uniref:glycine--tRNA ligase subunit beta n=1 Tax=Wenzhouxiangella sp. AB-CW3 TaxID=2771012 RepID=UPI00168B0829|nr:glycine--tRNA ligase subunit beta [Wenzhouxiangella sp. AB-CW3]QOC22608.1 glycine--tRNA ligase subunit beta [Wenzhouxiangella sp. AB-CW3]
MKASLLIEIGCEELPARQINRQLSLLADGLGKQLLEAGLIAETDRIERFGTPRRLAIRIPEVSDRQADRVLERKGPSLDVAYDEDGKPTRAAEGFARSVGQTVESLETVENEQGRWLFARVEQPGQALAELLPGMFARTIADMAGARSMRWSDREERFLRPVRWLLALHGDQPVKLEHFGLQAEPLTRGHRIHSPGPHSVADADDYERVLEAAHVLVDPASRHERIEHQVRELASQAQLEALVDQALLDEVAGLCEWPVAIMGHFDRDFLEVPEEALVSSMEQHQKCFALRSSDGALAPCFIAVANIESRDVEAMSAGFERVIHPRLADARFFWNQDRRERLADKVGRLDQILFQEKLGSIGDKVRRMIDLAQQLAEGLDADPATVERAALLSKCDLVTEMVGEFPELQGVMGRHYALADGEPEAVADAIEQHYLPRQAGDRLPESADGMAVALADRLDTLCGVFAAGQKPRGGKDPFALRRAALGVLRMLDASGYPASLRDLVDAGLAGFSGQLEIADGLGDEIEVFIFDRLRPWAAEEGIETNTVHAVAAGRTGSIADFMARARAVQTFANNPAVASLIAANKRASNLLKQNASVSLNGIDPKLLEDEQERALYEAMEQTRERLDGHLKQQDYPVALAELAELREPVDRFFDDVMVMTDDEAIRNNRLALLDALQRLFADIADVARLGR